MSRKKVLLAGCSGAHAKIGKGIMKSVTAGIISVILAWCSSKISPVVAL